MKARAYAQKEVPSIKALTTALKTAHFPYGSYNGYRGWYAKKVKEAVSYM